MSLNQYSRRYSDSSDDELNQNIENVQHNYQQPISEWEERKYAASGSDTDNGLKYEDLKQSLLESKNQLMRAKSNNESIIKEYKDAQEEIQNCHDQIARQAALIHDQTYKLEEARRQIYELSHTQSNLAQKSKLDITSFQNEIEQKDDEIAKLHKQLEFREEKIKVLYDSIEQQKERNETLSKEIKYKDVSHF